MSNVLASASVTVVAAGRAGNLQASRYLHTHRTIELGLG